MSRLVVLGASATVAFAAAFGLVKFVQFQSTPAGMVWVPGGEFTMGSDAGDAGPAEHPAHRVRVDGFWMDETDVTNAQFRRFVEATGYVTTAEKPPDPDEIQKQEPRWQRPPDQQFEPGAVVFVGPGWRWVVGADWRH